MLHRGSYVLTVLQRNLPVSLVLLCPVDDFIENDGLWF